MPDSQALIDFVRDRLAEEECQADLFHELTCTLDGAPGRLARPHSRCPVPAQLIERAHTLQRIWHECEHRLHHQDPRDPHWPLEPIFAEQTLRALALPYELHPDWHDQWYP